MLIVSCKTMEIDVSFLFHSGMNRVEADRVLDNQFFNPPAPIIDEEVETIERGSDL